MIFDLFVSIELGIYGNHLILTLLAFDFWKAKPMCDE
tara:strand:- start:32384 stop:32494 length:111 start_codon:yes stop_codon:yes gene_type:complete